VGFEVGLDCSKIRQGFCDNPGSVSGVSELKVFLSKLLMNFCSCSKLVVAVITIWGGLPVLSGVASSCGLSSLPEDSVSMLADLSGAKKFWVGTALGVVLTVAGAAVTTGFF
jgi:hypothetical protein